jgi:hypothetical protein
MRRATSAEDYKLISSFQSVRDTLLQDEFQDRLSKPLAYWALPNDRRLPLAFLGRPIGELLRTPFEELTATPGIGQKKISSLVKLLQRATQDEPPAVPFGLSDLVPEAEGNGAGETADSIGGSFDPSLVSEALWSQWCDAVKRHNVGHERLGRIAPSLRDLPTVIWATPLAHYLNHTMAEIRSLRTHGEKRVRCILEVFHAVYEKLSNTAADTDLAIRLVPRFVPAVESWITERMSQSGHPAPAEVRNRLAVPLLEQIRIDSGDTVYRIAQERLGVNGQPQSVRSQAERMGVTRARVYQLLDDCSKVMRVRWPEGRLLLRELVQKLEREPDDLRQDLSLFYAVRDLCFPERHHEHGDLAEG